MDTININTPEFDITKSEQQNSVSVANGSAEEVEVTWTVNRNTIVKKVVAPKLSFDSKLCLAILAHLRSKKFLSLSHRTREFRTFSVIDFFNYLEEIDYDERLESNALFVPDYISWGKKFSKRGGSIYGTFGHFRSILDWIIDPRPGASNCRNEPYWNDRFVILRRTLKKGPKKPEAGTTPALEEIFTGLGFSNKALLHSTRLATVWYLRKMQSIRKVILEQDTSLVGDIAKYVNKQLHTLEEMELKNPSVWDWISPIRLQHTSPEYCELRGRMTTAALAADDPVLNELLLCNVPQQMRALSGLDQTKHLSRSETKAYLLDCLLDTGSWHSKLKKLCGPKRRAGSPDDVFGLRDMLLPTWAENMALAWLLASDRIQSSSQEDLTLDDLAGDEQMQIRFYKGRNRKTFVSPLYKRSQPVFEVLKGYRDLQLDAKLMMPSLHLLQTDRLFLLPNNSFITAQKIISSSNKFCLQLLGVEGSMFRQACVQSHSDMLPFISLWSAVVEHNKNLQLKKITRGRVTIGVSNIAQTRVLIDELSDKPISYGELQVEANLTAHSLETKKNVYQDRSPDNARVEKGKKFAHKVGDAMVADAAKVADLLDQTKLLTLKEARKRLGLSTTALAQSEQAQLNEILNHAQQEEMAIGYAAQIMGSDHIYIIQTPLTSALMQSYVLHIESQIERVSQDSPTRAVQLRIEKAYLLELIKRFSSKLQRQGWEILEQVQFPFPDLV